MACGSRLAESIELAIRHGEGTVVVSAICAGGRRGVRRRSGKKLVSARSMLAPTASSASRNWSRGPSVSTVPTAPARSAKGWARTSTFDPELVMPDSELSLAGGAIAPWKGRPAGSAVGTGKSWPILSRRRAFRLVDAARSAGSPKPRQQLCCTATANRFPAWLDALRTASTSRPLDPAKHERLETFRGA